MCSGFYASAQITNYFDKFRPAKRWSVGLQVSATHAMSDADNFVPAGAFGGHVKYSVSQTFGLKLNGNFGSLRGNRLDHDISDNGKGKTIDPKTLDSYFYKNSFKELNLNAVFTLGNLSFLRPLRKIQVFAFTGFGAIWSNATGGFTNPDDAAAYYDDWGDDYFTAERDASGNITDAISSYEGTNFTIPFGVGAKRNFGKLIDLGIEYRMNYTRSDKLDAFSLPESSNRSFDFYGLLGFQASIKLGGKDGIDDHYDWLNPVESIYSTLDTLSNIQSQVELLLKDTDGDGVANYFDKEPDTQKDAWVWGNGVAADIDEDGVPDYKDDEPYSEKGATVDARGVMIDIDGDRVPDYRDADTKTIIGTVVTPNGNAPKVTNSGGCCDCNDVILPSVIFDNGSASVKPEFIGVLYSVAEKMKSCPDLKILITGYSVRSKSGSQIAFKRASAVVDFLNTTYNIPGDRFVMDTEGVAPSGLEYSSRRIDLQKVR